MGNYLEPYLPVGFYALLVALTGAALLFAPQLLKPHFLGPTQRGGEKEEPYECGVPLLGSSRERFSIKFYLVGILFVLFDIETIFLIPWAVVYRELGPLALFEMLIFLLLLVLGYFYAWRRGGLDWD